eukprot:9130590-Pyramimonas_sp.AAC.1
MDTKSSRKLGKRLENSQVNQLENLSDMDLQLKRTRTTAKVSKMGTPDTDAANIAVTPASYNVGTIPPGHDQKFNTTATAGISLRVVSVRCYVSAKIDRT